MELLNRKLKYEFDFGLEIDIVNHSCNSCLVTQPVLSIEVPPYEEGYAQASYSICLSCLKKKFKQFKNK